MSDFGVLLSLEFTIAGSLVVEPGVVIFGDAAFADPAETAVAVIFRLFLVPVPFVVFPLALEVADLLLVDFGIATLMGLSVDDECIFFKFLGRFTGDLLLLVVFVVLLLHGIPAEFSVEGCIG